MQTTDKIGSQCDVERTPQDEAKQVAGLPRAGKSCRRPPHKTTEAQKRILLAAFEDDPNPAAHKRERLAKLLNVERRIVKNWFSNQRALRRKTGLGYHGCHSSSVSSESASGSGDEFDLGIREEIESVTGTEASVQNNFRDAMHTAPFPDNSPQHLSSNCNVLRSSTNATQTSSNLHSSTTTPHVSFTHGMSPRIVLPPFSSLLVSRPPILSHLASTILAPCSWSLSLLEEASDSPEPRGSRISDQPAPRLDHEVIPPAFNRGYPESALRSSLKAE